jgi:hypothetical protein
VKLSVEKYAHHFMNIDSFNPFPAWNLGFIFLWLYYYLLNLNGPCKGHAAKTCSRRSMSGACFGPPGGANLVLDLSRSFVRLK